jgi:hypothetical protein
MAIVTGTLTVNAAFLREIKDDNRQLQELLAMLRDLTSNRVVLRSHRQRVIGLLEDLRDQLALHFALEEAYGYFEEAIDVAPHISEATDRLRAEHAILFESIRTIAEAAKQWYAQRVAHRYTIGYASGNGATRALSFHDIAIQFQHFSDQLLQHEQNENALILEAFDTDIGGQG